MSQLLLDNTNLNIAGSWNTAILTPGWFFQEFPGEGIFFEPPKNRKKDNKASKARRLEYRQNLVNNHVIELEPLD